jgi:glycosyltransferase EpsF
MVVNSPLKVLHIIHGFGMGGVETWLMQLLRRWSKTKTVKMDFLLTGGESSFFDAEAKELGAALHYYRYGRHTLSHFQKKYRHLLSQGGYDAIHDHADYTCGWHFALGLGQLPPVRVAHVHNPWLHIEANYGVSPVRRLTALSGKRLVEQFATHISGTSAEILSQYGWPPGRLRKLEIAPVHCGFEVSQFSQPRQDGRESVLAEFSWSADTKIILFVGRLDRSLEFDHPQNHKNSWFALNVARQAVAKNASVKLLMLGSGSQRSELEARIAAWQLGDRLRLIGVRDDVPRLMRAADILLFPSRQEGLGMVAVEAQAAGLPVLASSAVPQEARVISDLFYQLDLSISIDVWADTILTIMAKPKLPPEACRLALENSNFSIATSARKLENIYRSRR